MVVDGGGGTEPGTAEWRHLRPGGPVRVIQLDTGQRATVPVLTADHVQLALDEDGSARVRQGQEGSSGVKGLEAGLCSTHFFGLTRL